MFYFFVHTVLVLLFSHSALIPMMNGPIFFPLSFFVIPWLLIIYIHYCYSYFYVGGKLPFGISPFFMLCIWCECDILPLANTNNTHRTFIVSFCPIHCLLRHTLASDKKSLRRSSAKRKSVEVKKKRRRPWDEDELRRRDMEHCGDSFAKIQAIEY